MIAFFDLETRKLAADYDGDWGAFIADGGGGISALVIQTDRDATGSDWDCRSLTTLHDDSPESLSAAVAILEEVEMVVSFNGKRFDVPIIEACFGEKLHLKGHHDLCTLVQRAGGRRYGLDVLCEHTLSEGKSGDGRMAPELAQQLRFGELFDYCLRDVELTRKLYYRSLHEGVVLPNGRTLAPEEVWDL